MPLWHRLLGRPVSESGRLRHADGARGGGRRRPEEARVAYALACGYGIHFCLGAPLARLEAQIALPALLRALDEPELDVSELIWLDSVVFRGVTSLPVTFPTAPPPRLSDLPVMTLAGKVLVVVSVSDDARYLGMLAGTPRRIGT